MSDRETFAARLARLRAEAGLSRYRLALDAGLSERYLGELERGDKAAPSLAVAERLALILRPGEGLAVWDGCTPS